MKKCIELCFGVGYLRPSFLRQFISPQSTARVSSRGVHAIQVTQTRLTEERLLLKVGAQSESAALPSSLV